MVPLKYLYKYANLGRKDNLVLSDIYGPSQEKMSYADSDQGLYSQIESLDNIECFNGEKMPGWGFAHVQDDAHVRRHVFASRDPYVVNYNVLSSKLEFQHKTALNHRLECIWAASSKKVPSKKRRFRSFCACTKYHPGLCSSFIHLVSFDTICEQRMPWSNCADAQADLDLRCPHMPLQHVFVWRGIYYAIV